MLATPRSLLGILLSLLCAGLVCAAPQGTLVYLTKQRATTVESFVKVVNNRAWQGSPISVGGKVYKRGLGVHADSKLVFPLEGKFTSFHVVPGPDDAHKGTVAMKILVDQNEAFSSGPMSSLDSMQREPLTIPVTGAETLTLIVTDIDGKRGGDHASWADAYLQRPSEKPAPEPRPIASTHLPKDKLQPFLDQHCIACHGSDKQKAKVRFDTVSWEITNNDEAQRWQDVLDVLNGGEMPPEDEPQPATDELAKALDSLTGSLLTARRRLTDQGGEIQMRRLNRREYSNTIRHLFGFDVPHDDIPENADGSAFDTIGADQFFTSRHFDTYLELGQEIAAEAFKWNTAPHQEPKKSTTQPEQSLNPRVKERLDTNLRRLHLVEKEGKSWKEAGFSDEGALQTLQDQRYDRTDRLANYLARPKVNEGVYLSAIGAFTNGVSINRHIDIRGDYMLRIRGGIVGDPDPMRKIALLQGSHDVRGTVQFTGSPDAPETIEVPLRQSMGRHHLGIQVKENLPNIPTNAELHLLRILEIPREEREGKRSSLWVDSLELDGPFYPADRPEFEKLIYPDGYTPGKRPSLFDEERTREFLETLAFQVFRHQTPEPAYIDALMALYQEERTLGKKHGQALQECLAYLLASPSFLFLNEKTPDKSAEDDALSNRELAIRLAYFLWSAPPDDVLYAADLAKPNVLNAQVQRMLASPKSKALPGGFMPQWAELERFDAITIDPKEHYRFNIGIRHDASREVSEFFATLLEENLPARNLIDSDFVSVTPALATHYEIPGVDPANPGFQRVKLPDNHPRGGLLTQAAFLIAGSNGERSSPVIRGALAMEKLLHDEPAPPPPNVPELGSDDGIPRTNREMVKLHQEQAVCASCHQKMDVIGFGLENFDTIGRWRDSEPVGDKQVPINPGGTLPGGAAFANIQELKTTLLAHEDALARELMESMFAYGLGRTIEFSDATEIERLLALIKEKNYPVRSMIREVALSPLFRKR